MSDKRKDRGAGLGHVQQPQVLQHLPFPVAHPAETVYSTHTPETRLTALTGAYLALTRFLGTVCLLEYLGNPTTRRARTDEKLQEALSDSITDGTWRIILWTCANPHRRKPHRAFLPPLVSFLFTRIGERSEQALEFGEWVSMRNQKAHAEAGDGDKSIDELAREWTHRFSRDLESFSFLTAYALVQPIKIRGGMIESARVFEGPSINPALREEVNLPLTLEGVEPEEHLLLVDRHDRARQLSLSPLVHLGSAEDPLCVFQKLTRHQSGTLSAIYVSAAGRSGAIPLEDFPDARARREELTRLFGHLGSVGSPAAPTALKARAFAGGAGPEETLERLASAWASSGYPYEAVTELEGAEGLKQAVENASIWTGRRSETAEAFGLLLALHYRLSWPFWVARNTRNELGARMLLSMLGVANRHHRPRLRALYALQSFDKALIEKVLDEEDVDSISAELVRRHVLTGRVKRYLQFLAAEPGPYPIPHRAEEVLSEVEPSGGGGVDLPLGPEGDDDRGGAGR